MKKKLFLLNLIFGVLLFAKFTLAQTLDNALAASAESAKKTRFSGFGVVQHYAGFGEDVNEPSTLLFGQINYQLNKWILFAAQSANKVYYVADENEPEVVFSDTQVGVLRVIRDVWGGNLQLRAFATLPVSELSRRNGLITRPDFRFRNTWMFLDNKLALGLGAEFMLFLNQYTTTFTGPTDEGAGQPMQLFRTSLQSVLSYTIDSKWSLSGYAFYIDRQFERLGPSTTFGSGDTSTHDFWYGLTANYNFNRNWVGTLAFDHANTIEQNGNVDFVFFDSQTSQWSLGVNYIF